MNDSSRSSGRVVCGRFSLAMGVFALLLLMFPRAACATSVGVECEEFQFFGDWTTTSSRPSGHSGSGALFNGPTGARLPALTAVNIPRAGQYALWVRAADYPDQQPGTRLFKVSVAGTMTEQTFGKSGKPGYSWERGDEFQLDAGPVLLGLHDIGKPFARADAILLTDNLSFTPTGPLAFRRVKPLELPVPHAGNPFRTTTTGTGDAALENEFLRIEFRNARPSVFFRRDGQWQDAGADAVAESYVVVGGKPVELSYAGFYPSWTGGELRPFRVGTFETRLGGSMAIWEAGRAVCFQPRAVAMEQGKAVLTFQPNDVGELTATWELRPGERAARVELAFQPARTGAYSLGYHVFNAKPLAEVEELLLPMMWHRKRFPSRPVALLSPFTPTPVALMQARGVWGVCGDPSEIPFAWPDRRDPRFGLTLRNAAGEVQPAIYGPVPGTERAKCEAGATLRFKFRVLAQPGDWYAGYRTAADEVFQLKDYRNNSGTPLTEAALNMIDLVMDDKFGGWWERPKGPYQIETLNGVTHASPLTTLSLYWLTGNEELYRRRALPTMEFMLSRSHPHFSPEPDNTGSNYPAGNMGGPVRIYGTTAFLGLWELTGRRTEAFREIALPGDGVRLTTGYGHGQEFEEWLARGNIEKAKQLADEYLARHVTTPPAGEISPQPFFNVSFVPDWEGLLRMYEVTGEKRYLDGAVLGARQLMTSVWTQPVIPTGEVSISGVVSLPDHIWWKGPDKFRLGFPRRAGDAPAHSVPAWIPSNVGLSFEQPVTYNRRDTGGAMIYQSAWAPNFLRLAAYTGDKMFETYARNAVLGRWANYPGYYCVGFTDLPLNPRYPYVGPDLSCIYYHHILPHLSWTIDYLVAEAALLSGGKISFPSQRQHGYVWFDSRVYGHAPGKVFDAEGARLLFRRGAVKLDNPAINYLLAHTGKQLLVILMNESNRDEKVRVECLLGRKRSLTRTVGARKLEVLTFDGVTLPLPSCDVSPAPKPGHAVVATTLKGVEARAAAIQAKPGAWDAYVWCTALPKQARKVTFHYQLDGQWRKTEDAEYPFETTVSVADATKPLRFRIEGTGSDGVTFSSPEAVIGGEAP
ncbi:MAG: hypothetical protein FJ395_14900 [Verrucomicrobia bacterium]|nr:hypothetical protein [Verrucomicrobiota bacterium]